MSLLESILAPRIVRAGVEYVQRKTLEIVGAEVVVTDDPANDRITIAVPEVNPAHAVSHANGGVDAIDGDRVRIDYVPGSGYVPTLAPESTALEDLSAHLHGVSLATGEAQSTADTAYDTAEAAYDTALAASAASASAAMMFDWSFGAVQNGTQRLFPPTATSGTGVEGRYLVPVDGTLSQISVHNSNYPGGPSVDVVYTVWLSTDSGVTWTATPLTVAMNSKSRVAVHAAGSVAVSRGDAIRVEAFTPANIWDNYGRMAVIVLLKP